MMRKVNILRDDEAHNGVWFTNNRSGAAFLRLTPLKIDGVHASKLSCKAQLGMNLITIIINTQVD